MSSKRVIITRPYQGSGVGSNISSLIGALYLARKIGADLAIDWTNLDELRDKSINGFQRFFAIGDDFEGTRISHLKLGDLPDRVELPVSGDALRALVAGDAPLIAQLTRYHGLDRIRVLAPDICAAPVDEIDFQRRVYLAIEPAEGIAAKLESWSAANFGTRFIVGLNVRMGNGLFDKGAQYRLRVNTRVFRSAEVFRAGVARAIGDLTKNLPAAARDGVRVFFAADSRTMHDWLIAQSGFVTRRHIFPPPGVGHVFADYREKGYDDVTAFEDIVFDMFALARCNALIYNGTNFSQLARFRTNFYSGSLANVETYFPIESALYRIECGLYGLSQKLGLWKR